MKNLTHDICFNSGGIHKTKVNGRHSAVYLAWYNMIMRCYSEDVHLRQPAYIGCSISSDWHDFQDFADWYDKNCYSKKGYQLDKDLLVAGNKIYSPITCCFIPQELNKLLIISKQARGHYPQGVDFNLNAGKYRAQIRIDKKKVYLGLFDCPNEAHRAYVIAKESYVKKKALEWQDRIADNVFQALMSWRLAT